jgi:hypothetical protein
MRRFTFTNFVQGALAVLIACCLAQAVHAQVRLAADKITSDQVNQTLQDTRTNIKKQQPITAVPTDDASSSQIVLDICKKNPKLPQCKL